MPDPVPLRMRPRRYRHLLVMSLDRKCVGSRLGRKWWGDA